MNYLWNNMNMHLVLVYVHTLKSFSIFFPLQNEKILSAYEQI